MSLEVIPGNQPNAEPKLVSFPQRWLERRRRDELEFLPAALEIVETPSSATGRIMMGVIVVLVLVAVLWACVGQLDIVATANGRIIPTGQIKLIQPLHIGVVKSIAVNSGDHVAAGDVLIELDPTADVADRDRIERDMMQATLDIARLHAVLDGDAAAFILPPGADPALAERQRRQLAAQLAQEKAKIDGMEQQIAAKTADRDQAQATIQKLDASLPLLRQKAEIYETLLSKALTSKITVLEAERQFSEAKHDRLGAQYQVQSATAQVAALTQQRTEVAADFRRQALTELAKATQYAAEQRQELVKATQMAGLQTLRAPVSGTVEQLSVHTIGGIVQPAQTLMVVVPGGSKLEIEAVLPNRDAGFVHAGQPAEIKVEAFSYTRYGLLRGQVTSISRDALRNERDAPNPDRDVSSTGKSAPSADKDASSADSAYTARISLVDTSVVTEQGRLPLEPGMTVTAEIRTGERQVISYLLSPFMRYRHEALRER